MSLQPDTDSISDNTGKTTAVAFRCLPVTALHAVEFEGCLVLASGQGPWLTIHDHQSAQIRLREQIFEHQAIHGITSVTSTSQGHDEIHVFIWGARHGCISKLTISSGCLSGPTQHRCFLQLVRQFEVDDWILHGLVTAHSPSHQPVAYVVTAHNTVHELSCPNDAGVGVSAASARRICSGPESVLYSAHLSLAPPESVLVASGTVFGEIILWSGRFDDHEGTCHSLLHRVFLGHQGSIFGVCTFQSVQRDGDSKWLLASCSDDRTIRLWDITDYLTAYHVTNNASSQVLRIGSTGFRAGLPSSLGSDSSSTWAHLSRIWKVDFLQASAGDCSLVSVGEDASCQRWDVVYDNVPTLRHVSSDRHHTGKNIWSLSAVRSPGHWKIFTGGADGAIVERQYLFGSVRNAAIWTPLIVQPREFLPSPNHSGALDSESSAKDGASIKHYTVIGSAAIIASTNTGEILSGTVDESCQRVSWTKIYSASIPSLLSLASGAHDLAVAQQDGGMILLVLSNPCRVRSTGIKLPPRAILHVVYHHTTDSDVHNICLVLSGPHTPASELIWLTLGDSLSHEKTKLTLPQSFVLTSAAYDATSRLLVLGSRGGAVAVYDKVLPESLSLGPAACVRHAHASDSVTSVLFLEGRGRESHFCPHFLTTGRDGQYAVHQTATAFDGHLGPPVLTTVHRSSLPFGPHIEGAYLRSTSSAGSGKDLILYGFRSTDFVVWNESQQTTMFSVDCGGAHRSWTFRGDPASDLASFVWTKAGSVNFYRHRKPGRQILQRGGHGREIKAFAVSQTMVATGAEDTTIRIIPRTSMSTTMNADSWESCRVLDKHTTGIQHLEFGGQHLFSSAGCEEFFAWRICFGVPCIKIGIVFQCALPKDPNADARIPSFAVSSAHAEKETNLIAAAFSNGKVKVFEFHHSKHDLEAHFEVLREMMVGSFCLTQVHFLTYAGNDKGELLTSGTDGCFTVRPRERSRSTKEDRSSSHRVHQSCVHALTVCDLGPHRKLAISGGDDNAAALTVVSSDPLHMTTSFQSLLLPKAHTAAVTAITVLTSDTQQGTVKVVFATTGNDQRVKIWQVNISEKQHGPDRTSVIDSNEMSVVKVKEVWTSVADVSALAFMAKSRDQDGADRYAVLVAGVGIETLQLSVKHV